MKCLVSSKTQNTIIIIVSQHFWDFYFLYKTSKGKEVEFLDSYWIIVITYVLNFKLSFKDLVICGFPFRI